MLAYLSANTIDDALKALADENTAIVAGATDWFPGLGLGPAPQKVLDITGISELCGVSRTAQGWRIGATTRWCDVIAADLPANFDGLKAAANEVGSVQIQNTATVAGNICNASPAADGIPPLLALDCQVEIISTTGTRLQPLAEFITGVRSTTLQPGELVSALIVPDHQKSVGSSFLKLGSRKYLVISIVMVSAVIGLDQTGRIDFARVTVGACSPIAQCLVQLQEDLIGMTLSSLENQHLISKDHLAPLSPIDDTRGSAAFRLDVVSQLCQRAIIAAANGAG